METFNANELSLLMRTVKDERGSTDLEASGLAGSFRDVSQAGFGYSGM